MSLSRILVVDDSPASLESLAIFFEFEGFEVRTAGNGKLAVEITQEFQPGLILMDLRMPILDGYAAAREIRALELTTQPILVALSGWDLDEERAQLRDAGFTRGLPKPVSPAELRTMLAEVTSA